MHRLTTIILLTLALLAPTLAAAQEAPYKFDFGVSAGMSGYIGDANTANPFKRPGLDAALQARYIMNARMALRGEIEFATLSGSTADYPGVFPSGEVYEFKSKVAGINARYEFNFFPYGIGETYKRLRRWTPFIAVGLGCNIAMCGGTHAALAVPLGVGFKFKAGERVNILAEFTMTKNFSDHIDGDLADLYQIKSSFGKNTDWISTLRIGFTYEFGKRCETCHRID